MSHRETRDRSGEQHSVIRKDDLIRPTDGMGPPDFHRFHATSRDLDFAAALEGLLDVFRRGEIADGARRKEDAAVRTHLWQLSEAWDAVLPGYPWKRRTRQADPTALFRTTLLRCL